MRVEREAVRVLVGEFFAARGWRVAEGEKGYLLVEQGSLRRTVALGGLAGRGFHMRARLELSEDPDLTEGAGGTRIRYRWGGDAGRILGGAVGAARARRRHVETSAALAAHLRAQGLLREG